MGHCILRNEESDISRQSLINNTFHSEDDDNFLKNAAQGRKTTDSRVLICHAICMGILGILIIYCIVTGDIDRILKGHDKCGNVCGKKNDFKIQGTASCTSMDMTDKPYLLLFHDNDGSYHNECTENCTDGVQILNRCLENGLSLHEVENFLNNYASFNFNICAWEITALSSLTVAFALITLLMLRYFTVVFVWFSIIDAILLLATVTGFCWHLVIYSDGFIVLAVFSMIVTLTTIILVICMRNRIALVIQLFKESAKSLTSMPLLLIEPIMTIIVLAITFAAWIYFTLWIESAAPPVELDGQVMFIPNEFIKFVRFYNIFIMQWMVLFVYGCQNMLVAGAVARWYFIRDKEKLVNPILNSGITMLKYHLGTISIASLIITLINIPRILWATIRRSIRSYSYFFYSCQCFNLCIKSIGCVLNYFTLNIYVVSAIHGTTFYRSGIKAFNLFVNNTKNVIAVNSIGDFVLFLAKAFIIIIPTAIGYFMLKDKDHINLCVPLVFIACIGIASAQCFVMVFEMAITTIFICFCEDCEINDGISRPYYMSHNLMEFVEKSKAVLKVEDMI